MKKVVIESKHNAVLEIAKNVALVYATRRLMQMAVRAMLK